jgi:signal peptidase I
MMIQILTRYLKIIIIFVAMWLFFWIYNNNGCRRVESSEMEPTLHRDSSKWADPKTHRADQLRRDDLVSFSYVMPNRTNQTYFAARVIGLPGDRVKIEKGDVVINGEKISTPPYVLVSNRSTEDYPEVIVPRDHVFVLADNRQNYSKIDSRTIGPLGCWAITAKFR